jgi:pimeloyl-ACP methyl ester carboxylesterase
VDYATRRPARVERLALSCPAGIGRQKKGFLLKMILLNPLGQWGRRRSAIGMLGPGLETMDPAGAAMVLEQVLFVSKNYRYRMERPPVFDDDALRRLTMPVHVLAGEQDVMFDSLETGRRLEVVVPQAIVRLLPGVGHFIPAQADAELRFLLGTDHAPRRM